MKAKKTNRKHSDNSIIMFLIVGIVFTVFIAVAFSYVYDAILRASGLSNVENEHVYDKHYVMISNGTDVDLWNDVYQSMKKSAEERNIYVELQKWNPEGGTTYSEMIEKEILCKVDAIILQGTNDEDVTKQIEAAAEIGIPVVTIFSDAPETSRIAYVGINAYSVGVEYAEKLKEILANDRNEDIKVTFLLSDSDEDSNQSQIFTQARTTLLNEADIKDRVEITAVDVSAGRVLNVNRVIRTHLREEENQADYLVCMDATTSDIVYQTLVDYNLLGDESIIGYYTSTVMKQGLSSGNVIATLGLDADKMGSDCMEALEDYNKEGYNNIYYSVPANFLTKEDVQNEE